MDQACQAFVLRMKIGDYDAVPKALDTSRIFIGWSQCKGLANAREWKCFRGIVAETYGKNIQQAAASAKTPWAFFHEMNVGDLVVVPHAKVFYVAKITGSPERDEALVDQDLAHSRAVQWQGGGHEIPRDLASAALQMRMKNRGALAYASDLVADILHVVVDGEARAHGKPVSIVEDLRQKLVETTVKELRSGKMNPNGFEVLIQKVLRAWGAADARVVPKSKDLGADVVATFTLGGLQPVKVAVQAKHWQPEPPVERHVVDQLVDGMEAEGARIGLVITTGSIGADAEARVEELAEQKPELDIKLVDGDQFARVIVDIGLNAVWREP